jgi:peroxiredoxin
VVGQNAEGLTPDADDAQLFADVLGLSFPVLADSDGEFWPVWNPESVLPITIIIDADGEVVWNEAGGTSNIEGIEEMVLSLLNP